MECEPAAVNVGARKFTSSNNANSTPVGKLLSGPRPSVFLVEVSEHRLRPVRLYYSDANQPTSATMIQRDSAAAVILRRRTADTAALVEHRLLANPNTKPAGSLHGDTLTVALELQAGSWYPEDDNGRHETVLAFAETGRAGRVPGPLLRVRAGVVIHASIHNTRPTDTLTVRGLNNADVRIPPGATDTIVFKTSAPGTYYYWAATNGSDLEKRRALDTQLNGAIVVDSVGRAAHHDRVFVLSVWDVPIDTTGPKPWVGRTVMAINGKTWPRTERFDYAVGDTVRWRWVNPTLDSHPMHLHGFYFNVVSRGGALTDTIYTKASQRTAVTETMSPGGTMALQFTPSVSGHWLFHCHFTFHVSHFLSFDLIPDDVDAGGPEPPNHQHAMRGLVLGINIRPSSTSAERIDIAEQAPTTRQLRLVAARAPNRFGNQEGYAYTMGASEKTELPLLSEAIQLKWGEPVAITVVNRLRQATAVHWHGIELQDSYADGVPMWSGREGRLAPLIAPNDWFVARFTPPRSGTFIYHSHNNEEHQIGRIVQISAEIRLSVSLKQGHSVLQWKPVAKDGADLPANQQILQQASVVMGPGETLNVELAAAALKDLRLEVSSLAASWLVTVPLVMRDRRPAGQKSQLQ